jgi:outer membrane protein assembly factor BamA
LIVLFAYCYNSSISNKLCCYLSKNLYYLSSYDVHANNNIPKMLAFNSSFLKLKCRKMIQYNYTSQEIIITGINSHLLKSKIQFFLGIQPHRTYVFSYRHLQYWVERLKMSGFFTYVDANIYYFNNHQVIKVDVRLNPILARVSLKDCCTKLIPASYVSLLFHHQLGYPQSFSQIYSSISKIINWYHLRGYHWAKVTIGYGATSNCNLILNISEGIVKDIQIVEYAIGDEYSHPDKTFYSNYILSLLNITSGQSLNLKNLEMGILKLKNLKFLSIYNYEILRSSEEADDLILILNIKILSDKSTGIFSKKITFRSNLCEPIEQILEYLLHKLLYNHANNNINEQCLAYLYLQMSENDQIVHPLLIYKNYTNLHWISEWYLAPLIFIVDENFGFKHVLRNIGSYHNNITLNVQFPQTGPFFNIMGEIPWQPIFGNKLGNTRLKFFTNLYSHQVQQRYMLPNYLNGEFLRYRQPILEHQGLQLDFNCDIHPSLSLVEGLHLNAISNQHILLQNFIFLEKLGLDKTPFNLKTLHSQFKQIWIYNIQQFMRFKCILKYNSMNNVQYLSGRSKFSIKSIHYVPYKLVRLNLNKTTSHKYSHQLNFKLEQFLTILKHIVVVQIEFILSLRSKYCLPFSEAMILIGPEVIRGYSEEVFSLPSQLVKLNLEYHIPIVDQNTFFIFLDFMSNFQYSSQTLSDNLLLSQYNQDTCQFRVSCGLGLKLYIPIQKLPSLRIEYGYNIHKGSCLHLRVEH